MKYIMCLLSLYIGGVLANSWTSAFGAITPFCWPYHISKLWYSVLFNQPPF